MTKVNVAPFTVETGDLSAFHTTPDDPIIDPFLIGIVSTFVPFTFSPTGAAVYQLGQFGTAAKKLKQLDLRR